MNYKEEFLREIFDRRGGSTITAVFKNHNEIEYPERLLNLLSTDQNVELIYSNDTGEILFDRNPM